MIYAKPYNCSKHAWLNKNKNGSSKIMDTPLDIYKIDKENAKKKIDMMLEDLLDLIPIHFDGNEDLIVKQTKEALINKDDILLKKCALKHNELDYFIFYDYIYKNGNKITIFYNLFKNIEKVAKDYSTKLTFIPKFVFTKEILKSIFPNAEIETKVIYLDVKEFKIGDIDDNTFSKTDLEKYSLENINEEEPNCVLSRKCKKCEYRDYCNIPQLSVADLETTPNCWRKIDPIIKSNNSLKLEDLTAEQVNLLTPTQKARYDAYNDKNGVFYDKKIIKPFLDILKKDGYVSFDFETYSSMIPINDKYNNYAQIPYSYSLDIVGKRNGIRKHYDFIVDYKESDFDKLVHVLVETMPTNLPIVVYFKTFETTMFRQMQELYPEYRDIIQLWIDNVVDLYEVFSTGGYYDIKFDNSISLKNVYPVICNSSKYERLDINHGDDACYKYKLMFNEKSNDKNNKVLQKQLMDYNRLDTVSPVEIIKELNKIIKR